MVADFNWVKGSGIIGTCFVYNKFVKLICRYIWWRFKKRGHDGNLIMLVNDGLSALSSDLEFNMLNETEVGVAAVIAE